MNLVKVLASLGSSYGGLCERGRPGRFRCGDHGVKDIPLNVLGIRLAGSWKRCTALLLMTPAAVRRYARH